MSNYDTEYLLSEVYGLNPPALKNKIIYTRRMKKIAHMFEVFKEEFLNDYAQKCVCFNGYKNKCAYFKTNESELSVRTSLRKRLKVYPQFIGRASKKQFLQKLKRIKGFYKKVDEFIIVTPTHSGLKQFIIDNIGELVNLYLDCLMTTKYTLWIYGKKHNDIKNHNYIVIDSDNLPDLSDARLVQTESTWKQYNTVKWKGISIGEIRITKKGRIEFGFFIHRLINILHREAALDKEDSMGQIVQILSEPVDDVVVEEPDLNEVLECDSNSIISATSATSTTSTTSTIDTTSTSSVLTAILSQSTMGSVDTIGTVIDVSSDESYSYIPIGLNGKDDDPNRFGIFHRSRGGGSSVFCTALKNIFCFINLSIPLFILVIFLISEYEKNI